MRIKTINLKKTFRAEGKDLAVLNGINFEFVQGIGYAIQGISGVGKTTLINILAGLDVPSSGTVLYNEYNINEPAYHRVPSSVIGLIFQEAYLLQELTILENVAIKGLITKQLDDEYSALALLELVQLKHKAYAYPHQLSGGEQQRVSIARALYNKPKMVIADEPTAHLDKENKKIVLELLLGFKNDQKGGLIVSTHDPLVAEAMNVQLEIRNGNLIRAE